MKRFLSIVLTFLIVFGHTTIYGDTEQELNVENEYAKKLSHMGVFKGTDNGFELERAPTRIEGLIMMIRMLGKEDDSMGYASTSCGFQDVPLWALCYVDYGYDNHLTQGINNSTFGTNDIMTANMYATFMLRCLGYSDQSDFEYGHAVDFLLKTEGFDEELYSSVMDEDVFTRGDLAVMTYCALSSQMNQSNIPLYQFLILKEDINEETVMDIGLMETELFPESISIGNPINAVNGAEVFTIEFTKNQINISGSVYDEFMKDLRFFVYQNDTRVLNYNILINNGKFQYNIYHHLSDGDYTYKTYLGESKRATAWSWTDEISFTIEEGLGYFTASPVYKNNYYQYYMDNSFVDPNNYLGSSYKIDKDTQSIIDCAANIVGNLESDYDKALAIHDWMAENIYYDMDAYYDSGSLYEVRASKVLESKKGVCAAYANLYAALLRSQGIPCRVMSGYALGLSSLGEWSDENINKTSNHAWNEAFVDGRWLIIDVTWNSNCRYINGQYEFKAMSNWRYFDVGVEAFSMDHRID